MLFIVEIKLIKWADETVDCAVRWNRVKRNFNIIDLAGGHLWNRHRLECGLNQSAFTIRPNSCIVCIITWVVRALNADWLIVVVYQMVYQMVLQNVYFYSSNYVGNQFIITIMHLRCLWYMANILRLRAVSRHSTLHHA